MRLQTERLILRPLEEGDADSYAAIAADPRVMGYFSGTMTREQADNVRKTLMGKLEDDGVSLLAAQERKSGTIIGVVGLLRMEAETRAAIPSRPTLEIGWTLSFAAQGKGYATEAARACLAYAWETLGAPEVVAVTARSNAPSQKVTKRLGMVYSPGDDFEHPDVALPSGHSLRDYVLYRITRKAARTNLDA